MNRRARGASLALLVALLLPASAGAGGIEPGLERLAGGRAAPESVAGARLLAWDEADAQRGRARVWVQREPGVDWGSLRRTVLAVDPSARWEGETGEFAQVVARLRALPLLAGAPGVFYVLRPPRAVPLSEVVSEGLDSMRVPAFRSLGYAGQGARVAVLDLGFLGYQRLVGTELPSDIHVRSFFRRDSAGNGNIDGQEVDHGTACAEIVHDVAPGATMYLANVETPADLKDAVDWLVQQQVSVISHSVGWYFGGLDGEGPIDDIAAYASSRGILWVNAAGNEAGRHTWMPAMDANHNGLMEFDDQGDELLDFTSVGEGQGLSLVLLWDSWPTSTDLGFDIEIVDPATNPPTVLASTQRDFQGYPYAFREIDWTSPDGRPIAARIRLDHGDPSGRTLHVFRIGSGTQLDEHVRSDRSLLVPADSPSVVAVGAVDWQSDTLDSYSSRGALDGAPVKPELCGPVGVSTATYGPLGFRGTSAAAPHVAGAAALLASASIRGGLYDVLWSRSEMERILSDAALPAPAIVPLAWGIVRMPVSGRRAASAGPRLLGNPAFAGARWTAPCARVDVLDASGRVVARARSSPWDGRDDAGRPLSSGVYWVRCPGRAASRLVWLGR